jgi:hypothetical protein
MSRIVKVKMTGREQTRPSTKAPIFCGLKKIALKTNTYGDL